jgi:hypothetical protein
MIMIMIMTLILILSSSYKTHKESQVSDRSTLLRLLRIGRIGLPAYVGFASQMTNSKDLRTYQPYLTYLGTYPPACLPT